MTDKEAIKLALEALEACYIYGDIECVMTPDSAICLQPAISALKERLSDPMREVQKLGQEIEQEPPQRTEQGPVGSVVRWVDGSLIHGWFGEPPPEGTLLYAHPPQRPWVGLEGAEFGWFCHTDFLNARKYTKEQRKKICNQLLSEAQSWDIGEYQLMMHDSTKLKENT